MRQSTLHLVSLWLSVQYQKIKVDVIYRDLPSLGMQKKIVTVLIQWREIFLQSTRMITENKISKQEVSWPSKVSVVQRWHLKVKSCQMHCFLSQSLKMYARNNVHLNNLRQRGKDQDKVLDRCFLCYNYSAVIASKIELQIFLTSVWFLKDFILGEQF